MTNKERALQGLYFIAGDKELATQRDRAKELCFDFNNSRPFEEEKRQRILKELIGRIEGKCTILQPFRCDYGTYISVGDNFFANYNTTILDGGKVSFGDNVRIGPNCSFLTPDHAKDPKQRIKGVQIFKNISVGNNVWFGSNVVVLPGVSIGDNSIIGAGSIVTRNIPSNVLAAGNPCKVIREINEEDIIEEMQC